MKKNTVIVFASKGANDAITGLMADYSNALSESGLSVIQVTFDPAEIKYAVDLISKGEVSFAMTWLGLGQDISVNVAQSGSTSNSNVFELFQVPLVKLQGDLPAYYIDLHRDIPRNSVNLYQAQEFINFRRAWLPEANALSSRIPPIPMVPLERSKVDTSLRRKGTLFFVKNGNSPKALESLWETRLPENTAAIALGMASELRSRHLKDTSLSIGDWVASFLETQGIAEPINKELVWFFSAQMDDYLRRVKSALIAESILDLPVVVQGSFWEHLDFAGRRAKLVKGTDVFDSQRIVTDELGVIDMSANVDTWPHDRVQRAAGSYSLVITNRQGWLTKQFPEFADLAFDFDPDAIAARVADVLANRNRYLDLGVEFGECFRDKFPRPAFAEAVIALVDHTRWIWMEPRPQIQNFFQWSRHISFDRP